MMYFRYLLYYEAAISAVTVILTVYDKLASQSKRGKKHRVPENTLLLFGILGGSVAEYVTMLIIRHKTRHKKFMTGLPAMICLQAAIALWVYLWSR